MLTQHYEMSQDLTLASNIHKTKNLFAAISISRIYMLFSCEKTSFFAPAACLVFSLDVVWGVVYVTIQSPICLHIKHLVSIGIMTVC